MGIPTYFTHTVKNHRSIIRNLDGLKKIHNLYLDSNSIIYDALRSLKNPTAQDVCAATCVKISEYISDIRPTGTVVIAFDGVAPVAKMEQQRNRRYKTCFDEKIKMRLDDVYSQKCPKSSSNSHQPGPLPVKSSFTSTEITPGTEFMKLLGDSVVEYFAIPSEFNVKRIIVSASDVPGEGEHKIFRHIRDEPTTHATETTVIYGLDADLIMLTLNHLNIAPNMYLFRETPEFIRSIDNTLNPNQLYCMDIPELLKSIAKEYSISSPDYILLCFFLGNDFMPHFPSLNIRSDGHTQLMQIYKETFDTTGTTIKSYLTLNGDNSNINTSTSLQPSICWKNMRKMIAALAVRENPRFISEESKRNKVEKRGMKSIRQLNKEISNSASMAFDRYMLLPGYERAKERFIDPSSPDWQARYYEALFSAPHDTTELKKNVSLNYLEGLEWTFAYYTTGCLDWRWTYKYDYPPLLEDLTKYVPYLQTELISRTSTTTPVHPHVQLAYVLPKARLGLLPASKTEMLLATHPEWYGDDYEIEWSYCKYMWEGHTKMPEIDIEELVQLLD